MQMCIFLLITIKLAGNCQRSCAPFLIGKITSYSKSERPATNWYNYWYWKITNEPFFLYETWPEFRSLNKQGIGWDTWISEIVRGPKISNCLMHWDSENRGSWNRTIAEYVLLFMLFSLVHPADHQCKCILFASDCMMVTELHWVIGQFLIHKRAIYSENGW